MLGAFLWGQTGWSASPRDPIACPPSPGLTDVDPRPEDVTQVLIIVKQMFFPRSRLLSSPLWGPSENSALKSVLSLSPNI